MNKLESPVKKNMYIAAALLVPAVILVLSFLILEIYPFGSRNIIDTDLYLQYMPIMEEFQRFLHGQGNLLYSFNGGLGTNFYALSTFQNASPITWLFLLLFKESQLVLCVTLMIMLKICLASCTMFYYLDNTAEGTGNCLLNLALGMIYALSGYVIAYYYNVMWLETVILLPIVVLGMRKAMAGRGNKLYTISLALMLMTSYYTALITCVFLLLYFFVHYFADYSAEKINAGGFVRTIVHIGVLTIFSFMISMVILLPSLFALVKTNNYATLGEGITHFFYHDLPTHFAQLLPGSNITKVSGPPNLYSGLVTLLLFFIFIFNNGINRRKRIIKGAFLFFLFACTNIIPLDMVWHLFHMPNGIPARYSFVLTFMLIEISAESLRHIDKVNKKYTILSFACILIIYAIALLGNNEAGLDKRFMLFFGIAMVALYGFVFFVAKGTSLQLFSSLLTTVIVLEMALFTLHGIGANKLIDSNRYHAYKEEITQLINIANKRDPAARMEIIGTDNNNAPYVYNYKGTSIFASSVPDTTYKALYGILDSAERSRIIFKYGNVSTSSDALLNIRHYISLGEELDSPGLKLISQIGDCYLYANPYRTSPGYMLPSGRGSMSGLDPEALSDFFNVDVLEGNKVSGEITASKDGTFVITLPEDKGWHLKVDGQEVKKTNKVNHFIAFPLKEGYHKIEMNFITEGLIPGIIISVLAVIIYIIYEINNLRRAANNK